MKITQAIKMAFTSICSTKLRSFLTMLGIIIGVMSVTVLVSIVQSTTNNVSDTLSQLGGNVISATVTSRRSNKITTSDLKSLENNPAIESVSPIISGSSTAKASGNSSSVTLKGITILTEKELTNKNLRHKIAFRTRVFTMYCVSTLLLLQELNP